MKKMSLIFASLAVCAAVAMPIEARSDNSPSVEVTGSVTINIVPDRITIEVGMEEYYMPDAGGDSVIVKLPAIEKTVRKAFRSAGVPDSLIIVTDMGNYINRGKSSDFLMAKSLSATVTDLNQVEWISQRLNRKGITSFRIIKLDNTDMERYDREGLKAALDAARDKAEFIAKNEGARSILPYEIVENGLGYYDMPVVSNVSLDNGTGMERMRRITRRYSVRVKYIIYWK